MNAVLMWAIAGAFALGSAGGGFASWHLGRAPLESEIAQLKEDNAEAIRLAAIASSKRLQDAKESSDQLTKKLAVAEVENRTLSKVKTDEIKAQTTGRACLDAGALRVLSTAPGLTVAAPAGVPQASGSPVDAGGSVATDSNIGTWAIEAGEHYETCRARLDALIAWERNQAIKQNAVAEK